MKKRDGGLKNDRKVRISHRFVAALSIVSIVGFIGIISESIFSYDLGNYVESSLMVVIGIGLIFEAQLKKLRSLGKGLSSNNITHLTTTIVGIIAILAGVFSLPQFGYDTPSFLAVKGILSFIAIVIIVIQTWVAD